MKQSIKKTKQLIINGIQQQLSAQLLYTGKRIPTVTNITFSKRNGQLNGHYTSNMGTGTWSHNSTVKSKWEAPT